MEPGFVSVQCLGSLGMLIEFIKKFGVVRSAWHIVIICRLFPLLRVNRVEVGIGFVEFVHVSKWKS